MPPFIRDDACVSAPDRKFFFGEIRRRIRMIVPIYGRPFEHQEERQNVMFYARFFIFVFVCLVFTFSGKQFLRHVVN